MTTKTNVQQRVQDVTIGTEVRTPTGVVTVTGIERKGADIFRLTYSNGSFRTIAWGGTVTLTRTI